jgi:hypothetical protein
MTNLHKQEITCVEWLEKFNAGEEGPTIEMGGFDKSYEMAIQTAAAIYLQVMLDKKYDANQWGDGGVWKKDQAEMGELATVEIEKLGGITGAMDSVAVFLRWQVRIGEGESIYRTRLALNAFSHRGVQPVAQSMERIHGFCLERGWYFQLFLCFCFSCPQRRARKEPREKIYGDDSTP